MPVLPSCQFCRCVAGGLLTSIVLIGCATDLKCERLGRLEPDSEALDRCEAACEDGNHDACGWVGIFHQLNPSGGSAGTRAHHFYSLGCAHVDDAEDLLCVLAQSTDGESDPRDLLRFCEAGNRLACHAAIWPLVVERTIPIELPPPAGLATEPESLRGLLLEADGSLFLDGSPTRIEELGELRDASVTLSAGAEVPYSQLAEVIETLRSVGVEDVGFSFQPLESDASDHSGR